MTKITETDDGARSILEAYNRHTAPLKRFVSKLLGRNKQEVEDVVQEAFLLAYRAENRQPIEQPKAFLFKVAKNVALNNLRQEARRPTDYLEDHSGVDTLIADWTLEDELMAQQKLELHCAAVASLPPKCRKVYIMRKVYSMSHREIADALDIAVSTVENHLEKGFARCALYVEAHMKEAEVGPNPSKKERRG